METTLRVPGRLEKSRRDHQRILEALLAGDPAAARRAAKAHIRGARSAALLDSHDHEDLFFITREGNTFGELLHSPVSGL